MLSTLEVLLIILSTLSSLCSSERYLIEVLGIIATLKRRFGCIDGHYEHPSKKGQLYALSNSKLTLEHKNQVCIEALVLKSHLQP